MDFWKAAQDLKETLHLQPSGLALHPDQEGVEGSSFDGRSRWMAGPWTCTSRDVQDLLAPQGSLSDGPNWSNLTFTLVASRLEDVASKWRRSFLEMWDTYQRGPTSKINKH